MDFPCNRDAYDLLEEIGHGSFSIVYRGVRIEDADRNMLGIKVVKLVSGIGDVQELLLDAKVMQVLSHPNLVRIHCAFPVDDNTLWIVMPFMNNASLLSIMSTRTSKELSPDTVLHLLREILKGIDYLHRHGIVHRNIKLSNVLVDSNEIVISLADFGVSGLLHGWAMKEILKITDSSVPPYWIAPEMRNLNIGVGYSFKADIYSFGCTALELTRGPLLYNAPPAEYRLTQWFRFLKAEYEAVNVDLGEDFRNMIKLCLDPNPINRPTCENLLKHAYFQDPEEPKLVNLVSVFDVNQGAAPLGPRHLRLKLKERKISVGEIKRDLKKRKVVGWTLDENELKFSPILHIEDDSSALSEVSSVIEKVEGAYKRIVLGKFKDEISDEEVTILITRYAETLKLLEFVKTFQWGKNVSFENRQEGYTHIFELTFETYEDMSAFTTHPSYIVFPPALEKVLVFQCKPINVPF